MLRRAVLGFSHFSGDLGHSERGHDLKGLWSVLEADVRKSKGAVLPNSLASNVKPAAQHSPPAALFPQPYF